MRINQSSKLTSRKQLNYVTLTVVSIFISCNLFAQKNMIGIYSSGEWGSGRGLRNVSGLIYERKITNHFGIETGAHLHVSKYTTNYSSNATASGVKHYYTNVPILFKYYSNIVNIAAGPTLNIFTARNEFNKPSPIQLSEYEPKVKDVSIGYIFKISKSFNIKDKFVLEPEVNLGNRFEFRKPNLGIGASFKYKF